MKASWMIKEVKGIGIYVHWTFLILVGWIVAAILFQGRGWVAASWGVLFIVALFTCVVLHELGHALTARRFGVRTRDIILLPIGGVARMESIPEDPRQEFFIAIAGPAVTLAIAAALFVITTLLFGTAALTDVSFIDGNFLATLMWINVILLVFNLIPAFPMDGGRVLRSFLSRITHYARATRIAAGIGQALAILLGFLGFFTNPFLLFIALFVYLGAQGEAQHAEMRSTFRGWKVGDAMMTHFRALSPDDILGTAADELLAGDQHDFPIIEQDKVVGILPRHHLIKGLANQGRDAHIRETMFQECGYAARDDALETAYTHMKELGCGALPVMDNGQLVGLISLDNIGEWIMVQTALQEGKTTSPRQLHPLIEGR